MENSGYKENRKFRQKKFEKIVYIYEIHKKLKNLLKVIERYDKNKLQKQNKTKINERRETMKKKLWSILLCSAMIATGGTGLGMQTVYAEEAEESYTVGFIVGSREHVFYNLIEDAIEEKCAELGIEAICYDGELDANIQSNHIENLVAQEVDAIALATVDAAGVGPAIEAADEAGIPMFTFDSPCNTVDCIICHVGTDNVEGGRLGAQECLRLLGDEGGTAAIIGNPASSSCLDRENGFLEVMENEAPDNVEVEFNGNYQGDANVASSLVQDWLTADPDLGVIFATGDPACTGALASIKSAGADTLIVGYDGNPEAIEAIYNQDGDGKWWVSEISQDPPKIGHTIVEQIYKYLTTGEVDAEEIPIEPYIITYEYIEENDLMSEE